jgi:hypothetical protein
MGVFGVFMWWHQTASSIKEYPLERPPAWFEDWQTSYEHGDLLFASKETEVPYRPEIGNGFVGTVVGSDSLFAAGVFSGASDGFLDDLLDPSHRAAMPSPLPLRLDSEVMGAALDLRNAAYLRRYSVDNTTVAELRFYAHRERRSLLVVDLQLVAVEDRTDHVTVDMKGGQGSAPSSKDLKWHTVSHQVSGHNVLVWIGETLKPEMPDKPKARVAIALPENFQGATVLKPGSPMLYIAAVRTSLESEDPETDALADWAAGMEAGAHSLFASHSEAWAALWESGLEVTGRMDVARAVNSSLYYILSSIREDAAYSLTPGGLASDSYSGHTFWDSET